MAKLVLFGECHSLATRLAVGTHRCVTPVPGGSAECSLSLDSADDVLVICWPLQEPADDLRTWAQASVHRDARIVVVASHPREFERDAPEWLRERCARVVRPSTALTRIAELCPDTTAA